MIAVLLITGVLGFTTNYFRRYLGAKVSVHLQHDLRLAIHRHLYELDFSRHDELSVGDVMSRATADLTLMQIFFFSVPMLIANLTLLCVALIVMFVLSPRAEPDRARVHPRVRVRRGPLPRPDVPGELERPAAVRIRSPASSTRRSPACGSSRPSPRRIASSTGWSIAPTCCSSRGCEPLASTPATPRRCRRCRCSVSSACSPFGGWLALEGHLTLGVFLAFASYLVQIVTPVRLVSSMLGTTQQARAGAERVFELLDMEPRVTDAPDARPIVDPQGAIDLDRRVVRLRRHGRDAARHHVAHRAR